MAKKTKDQISISAKKVAELASHDFCPRCFWIKNKTVAPFQMFPGIFNRFDAMAKMITEQTFENKGLRPNWMNAMPEIEKTIQIKSYHSFTVVHKETGMVLTGVPDALFKYKNGTHGIVDYKVSIINNTQEQLYPVYLAQLSMYKLIGEMLGYNDINFLALLYCEPKVKANIPHSYLLKEGFLMNFEFGLREINFQVEVQEYIHRAFKLLKGPIPTVGREDCKECIRIDKFISEITQTSHS